MYQLKQSTIQYEQILNANYIYLKIYRENKLKRHYKIVYSSANKPRKIHLIVESVRNRTLGYLRDIATICFKRTRI